MEQEKLDNSRPLECRSDPESPVKKPSLSPTSKLGYLYNRDAELAKKKRTSLRQTESDSDADRPTLNHADHSAKTVQVSESDEYINVVNSYSFLFLFVFI